MAEKIWLKHYPEGIPAEIDADEFPSLPAMLDRLFARFADRPAYHNLGVTIDYAELERQSRAFAAFLQNLPGMMQGVPGRFGPFGICRQSYSVPPVSDVHTQSRLHQLTVVDGSLSSQAVPGMLGPFTMPRQSIMLLLVSPTQTQSKFHTPGVPKNVVHGVPGRLGPFGMNRQS